MNIHNAPKLIPSRRRRLRNHVNNDDIGGAGPAAADGGNDATAVATGDSTMTTTTTTAANPTSSSNAALTSSSMDSTTTYASPVLTAEASTTIPTTMTLSTAVGPKAATSNRAHTHEEQVRQRNEISAFAMMALGADYSGAGGGGGGGLDSRSGHGNDDDEPPMNNKMLMINDDDGDNDGDNDNDDNMNMSGFDDSNDDGFGNDDNDDNDSNNKNNNAWSQDAFSQAIAEAHAMAADGGGGETSTTTTSATTTATPADSGTFAFDKSKNESSSSAERSNLEAALAALEKDPNQKSSSSLLSSSSIAAGSYYNHYAIGRNNNHNNNNNNNGRQHSSSQNAAAAAAMAARQRIDDAPMYSEQVILSRPLFFGPILPPRVIRQARAMVVAAYEELGFDAQQIAAAAIQNNSNKNSNNTDTDNNNQEVTSNSSNSKNESSQHRQQQRHRPGPQHEPNFRRTKDPPPLPRLSDLPDSVRNVVGAIRTFGHGIDVLEQDPEVVDPKYFWKGSHSHVVVYAPVWGEAQRLEQIRAFEKEYPRQPRRRSSRSEQDEMHAQSQSQHMPLSRPQHITARSSTAPARIRQQLSQMPPSNNNNNFSSALSTISNNGGGVADSPPFTDTGQSTSESCLAQNCSAAELAWLNAATGGSDGSFDSTERTSSPNNNNNDNNRSQRASENEQFSAWIRSGDDDSSAASGDRGGNNPFRGDGGGASIGSARSTDDFSFNNMKDTSSSPPPSIIGASPSARQQAAAALAVEQGANSSSNASALESGTTPEENKPMSSEQMLFSQWARGVPAGGGSIMMDSNNINNKSNASGGGTGGGGAQSTFVDISAINSATFQKTPANAVDSDDDSVIDDELKKQVGLSDHLSKALASLANDGGEQPDITFDDSDKAVLSQVLPDGSGRPLTNYELSNGCVPLFGVDDPPLPVESDLGIHETKEEQQRAYDQKKSQEIVEKLVGPNVFGSIACPNPALNPDDFHSWNARVSGSPQRLMGMTGGGTSTANSGGMTGGTGGGGGGTDSTSLPSLQSRRPGQSTTQDGQPDSGARVTLSTATAPTSTPKQRDSKRYAPRTRYGWWNVGKQSDWPATVSKPKEKDATGVGASPVAAAEAGKGECDKMDVTEADQELQLPPLHHSSSALQVVTALEPTPGQLRKDNLPLSHMHAATTMAQTLPYISDRPPSYRYLQVDTQGVGFPPVGGEVEPLFCSLAIYNVETVSTSGTASEQSVPPVPDLQRCGRVTEVLNFDVVRDSDIAQRNHGALWPYDSKNMYAALLRGQAVPAESEEQLEGTRCGVFPLPSNLNFANLYAVLIVHKVLSEDSLDLYLKLNYNASDLSKIRSNAERASKRYGAFLVPFSFGVAPLLQVFGGVESPAVTSSRAVQIPLFRFSPGLGERQIIEHIMVMLNPKADHRAAGVGGPVARTNGGTAMLVMRNFGYLGLHQVVDNVSSLARDRLVDFTGELQVRRRDVGEKEKEEKTDDEAAPKVHFKRVVPEWGETEFVAEPTKHGGRNNSKDSGPVRLSKYAQELAPVPLQLSPSVRLTPSVQPGMPRSRLHGHDIEPFYHTTFCNEMLIHPRLIHNCPKGNIAIKVELREIEWNQNLMAYFAHLPGSGPAIHCNRRGPFLVQSAFTSCVPRGSDKHFMDEFKLKLPLDLKPRGKDGLGRALSLFFTVYNIKMSCKKKWKQKLFGGGSNGDSFGGFDDLDPGSRMEQVACGFLPITTSACLIENGLHDVRILYAAHRPTKNLCEQEMIDDTTMVLVEKTIVEGGSTTARENSYAEDTTMSNDETGSQSATDPGRDSSIASASASEITSIADDSLSKSDRGKVLTEPVSLSVRLVVHSSLHCQNEMLSEFFDQEPDLPQSCPSVDNVFLSKLRMGRDFLLSNAVLSAARITPASEDKLYESTIEIVKYQVCPVARTHGHFLRAMSVLWRSLLSGTGKPDLAWANPAATLPLRLHAFASILQLLGSVSLFLTKNGVTLVDGKSKWNVVKLGRVVALLFDEQNLFGEHATEAFDKEYWAAAEARSDDRAPPPPPSLPEKKSSPVGRKARHVRQNYDIFNGLQNRETETSDSHVKEETKLNDGTSTPQSPKRHEEVDKKSQEYPVVVSPNSDQSAVPPAPQRKLKVDSKLDFQSALRAANAASSAGDDFDRPSDADNTKVAKALIQDFGNVGNNGSNRRWAMTLPSRALSTIREGDDGDIDEHGIDYLKTESITEKDALDNEIVINHPTEPLQRKQMRIPKARQKAHTMDFSSGHPEIMASEFVVSSSNGSLPKTDEEIESAGTAFIDVIGKTLGLGHGSGSRGFATEEQSVGSSHHRKTRSRSSIDWSLLGDGNLASFNSGVLESSALEGSDIVKKSKDHDETLSTLKTEESTAIKLPDFADRLIAAGKTYSNNARWFPFAYEVIILQWSSILIQQRAAGEKSRTDRSTQATGNANHPPSSPSPIDESVAAAAARSIGVAVAGAPMLFEVIKQSLGFRISTLFREVLATTSTTRSCPPLVTLDETLLIGLEQVVSMVADACIDSRNFDSWDLRQMSIDVNDSIIRFLRDMWSFLAPSCVYRLVLVYLSRFVTKDGKHWQDRDSSIGLRCSWEITKLRLSAVTALIRFPDFIRVNGPQMLNWTKWWAPSPTRSDVFFNDVFDQYQGYRLIDFVGSEGGNQHSKISIPAIHPHWLAEIAVDVCLLGTEHAEPQIQQRSAALLHEFFWASSQEGILSGLCVPVASMYITFIEKILSHVNFLSNFSQKSQLRKDMSPCLVFVLQSAPSGLVRAFWRRLCGGLPGQALNEKYGGSLPAKGGEKDLDPLSRIPKNSSEVREDPNILDMFGLLNLTLRTMEYEGAEEHLEGDGSGAGASRDSIDLWRKEYLLSKPRKRPSDARSRRARKVEPEIDSSASQTSTISRKWQGHDGSLVIINAGHQIVWEMHTILNEWEEGGSFLNPAVKQSNRAPKKSIPTGVLSRFSNLSHADIVVFIRAASSLYLHSLALRQSDIVIVRTFKVSAELIKIFGIKTFLEAIGETLQHWMRVISLQCGARRASVRIEATDLLELILRSTWECYGSFFRIRVPLLAVQTEVMERIVATAAARYYRDQRRLKVVSESFSNVSAEASLVPLWRTLDRIEKQPASQNIAFRRALIRMSGKLKKLYRAYIAARVLSFIQGARANEETEEGGPRDHEKEALVRANRISILRVINVSQGHSKQFLGFHATTQQRSRVAHFEAVEDALVDAADVFSPTELPEHRVAWLRMLADFHNSRKRFAEEGTCHFQIHVTLQQAARLHGSLWSNTPFLPWTDNIPDPVYIDGDSPTTDPDYESESGFDEAGGQYGSSPNSFRRIFYRVANSVAIPHDDWDTGIGQNLFCGIATLHEYYTVSPWVTLRDMEDQMVEEAETAGELFLNAGIIESSRFAWSLATQYYAQKFNYSKLALAYANLARTVVSKVPPIDASLPQEVSAVLGRFYRVWFHGGAPDELSGVEFVYRTEGSVRLDQFGQKLQEVIKSIIPDKTPIHLVLDGKVDRRLEDNPSSFGLNRLGPTPLEPVRIKVTPLRPLFGSDNNMRGLPEWFYRYADEAFTSLHHRSKNELDRPTPRSKHTDDVSDPHHHGERTKSFSAAVFSSTGSSTGGGTGTRPLVGYDTRASRFTALSDGVLSGVDKFCFLQPKDRSKSSKEWWRNSSDYAEKALKVTQLQVAQSFPACVARQAVVHRLVYSQSPLEAGVDAVCQWNAVLFRTAVATIGMAVLGTNADPGIGTEAVKVVADCIHSSHIKEIGLGLMKKNSDFTEGDSDVGGDLVLQSYDRLSDDEVKKFQLKLARLIVVFIELLHLLIARNRQMLLDVIQERRRNDQGSVGSSRGRGQAASVGPASSTLPESVERRSRDRTDPRAVNQVQRSNSIGSNADLSVPASVPTRDHPHGRNVQIEIQGLRSDHRRHHTFGGRSEDGRIFKNNNNPPSFQRAQSEVDQQSFHSTASTGGGGGVRADSAIAVQSELQRAFINMVKTLYPRIQGVMQADTPRWLKQCTTDSYFSLGTYKQTKVPIADELCFTSEYLTENAGILGHQSDQFNRDLDTGSVGGGSNHSVVSRGSERYGNYGHF